MKRYYAYIMTNQSGTLYTGVTNNVTRRIYEHKQGVASHFTAKYRITRLLYVEETQDIHAALAREKQIKGWTRAKKLALIKSSNPHWKDLSADCYAADESQTTACAKEGGEDIHERS